LDFFFSAVKKLGLKKSTLVPMIVVIVE